MIRGLYHQIRYRGARHLTLVAGVSIVELMVALSLFAVMAAGAFAALSVFDRIQADSVSQKNTLENQRRDFLKSYDRILKGQTAVATNDSSGLTFFEVPTDMNDCRFFSVDNATSTVSFYTNDDLNNQDALGCPAHSIMQQAYTLSTTLDKSVYFGIGSTGKICEGRFDNASNFTAATNLKQMRVIDPNCLTDGQGNMVADNGTLIFPEYLVYDSVADGTAGSFGAEVSTAIFFPFDRLTQPTLAQCGVTSNLEFPIAGFDIDGDEGHDSDDQITDVTVTISGGFDRDQDRLYIRGATEDAHFSAATNAVGDIIHSYANISSATVPTFPDGLMISSASYNASQGFMRITASSAVELDVWERVFDEVIYINLANSDDDPQTVFNPVDKQIVFSLGQYPARQVDGDYHFYHFEDCASTNCVTWDDAYDEAGSVAKKHLGLNGYLATVTSEEENVFISDRARSENNGQTTWAAGWLGATGDLGNTQDNATCMDVTGSSRNLGNWYWVTGKQGAEKCTLFWKGLETNGQPIDVEGNPIDEDIINPNSSTAWNCDNADGPNRGDVVETLSNGKSLMESWWYDHKKGRDNTSIRYANWSAGSTDKSYCWVDNDTIGEPNNCCSQGEHFLQMTGLPSGARLWNDLYGATYSGYNPGSWYEVRGYFIEWDTSQADPDVVLARPARLNTRRHEELCDPITVDED